MSCAAPPGLAEKTEAAGMEITPAAEPYLYCSKFVLLCNGKVLQKNKGFSWISRCFRPPYLISRCAAPAAAGCRTVFFALVSRSARPDTRQPAYSGSQTQSHAYPKSSTPGRMTGGAVCSCGCSCLLPGVTNQSTTSPPGAELASDHSRSSCAQSRSSSFSVQFSIWSFSSPIHS